MKRFWLVAAVIALIAGVVAATQVSRSTARATSRPQIGSSRSSIDHVWRRDSSPCLFGVCGYKVFFRQPLWIQVQFGKGGAEQLEVGFDPDKFPNTGPSPASSAYWAYLIAFLPGGARKKSCRRIAKTGGADGPAYACLYSYKRKPLLIAHYLTTNLANLVGGAYLGWNYDNVVAGKLR